MDAADVPRERLDVYVDGDGGRRRAYLPAEVRRAPRCSSSPPQERVTQLVRRADRADHAGQRARARSRRSRRRGVRVMTAGAPPAAVTIQRIEGELGWTVIQIYGLTETAPSSASASRGRNTIAMSPDDARHQGAPGRRAHYVGRAARRRRRRPTTCRATDTRSARSSLAAMSSWPATTTIPKPPTLHGRRLVPYRRRRGCAP